MLAVPRKLDYQVGSLETVPKGGFMQSILYFQVQQILGLEENGEVLRAELKKSNV